MNGKEWPREVRAVRFARSPAATSATGWRRPPAGSRRHVGASARSEVLTELANAVPVPACVHHIHPGVGTIRPGKVELAARHSDAIGRVTGHVLGMATRDAPRFHRPVSMSVCRRSNAPFPVFAAVAARATAHPALFGAASVRFAAAFSLPAEPGNGVGA